MNGYITVQEAAEKWRVTPRQVQILCKENRIEGAVRMSRIWIIQNILKSQQIRKKLALIMLNLNELQELANKFEDSLSYYKNNKNAYNEPFLPH